MGRVGKWAVRQFRAFFVDPYRYAFDKQHSEERMEPGKRLTLVAGQHLIGMKPDEAREAGNYRQEDE